VHEITPTFSFNPIAHQCSVQPDLVLDTMVKKLRRKLDPCVGKVGTGGDKCCDAGYSRRGSKPAETRTIEVFGWSYRRWVAAALESNSTT